MFVLVGGKLFRRETRDSASVGLIRSALRAYAPATHTARLRGYRRRRYATHADCCDGSFGGSKDEEPSYKKPLKIKLVQ